jgi:hypothetical protein
MIVSRKKPGQGAIADRAGPGVPSWALSLEVAPDRPDHLLFEERPLAVANGVRLRPSPCQTVQRIHRKRANGRASEGGEGVLLLKT